MLQKIPAQRYDSLTTLREISKLYSDAKPVLVKSSLLELIKHNSNLIKGYERKFKWKSKTWKAKRNTWRKK